MKGADGMFEAGDSVKLKSGYLLDSPSGIRIESDKIYEIESIGDISIKFKGIDVYWYAPVEWYELSDKPTEDKGTCVHIGKLTEDIPDSVHCAIYDHAIMKGDCLGNCEMQTEDKPDTFEPTRLSNEFWNEFIDNIQKSKNKFQPTKKFLLEHKDEYAYVDAEGDMYMFGKLGEENYDEDLSHKRYKKLDITKIYKATKVWERERDTRRELTIAEVEKEFNVKIKRESVE